MYLQHCSLKNNSKKLGNGKETPSAITIMITNIMWNTFDIMLSD